jgi:Histidine kinase-, DNA gyrase B-, and HSP90-like ATPase
MRVRFDRQYNRCREKRDISAGPAEQQKGLPDNYSGYKLKLKFSGSALSIEDNCSGISIKILKKVALRFGERSGQPMGIGAFGVGLNRALFRLGNVSHIITDTGTERAEVTLKKEEYLRRADDWNLPAAQLVTKGIRETKIEIRDLEGETSLRFGRDTWVKTLARQIARRYGRFIEKGFEIWVDNTRLHSEEVKIREDGPYEADSKVFTTTAGVHVHIEYGQHKLHRFPLIEGRDSDEQNRRLTAQYGWTIFCNDRAVILSDQTPKTGWDIGKFHSDFYGFVGNVNFVSQRPELLPWKTTKTDIDLNNPSYQETIGEMRKFTKKWRSEASRRKPPRRGAKEPFRPLPPKKSKPVRPEHPKAKVPAAKIVTKEDHNQFREVLPQDIQELHCDDKHLALVHEAKRIDMVDNSYAGLALIRMLFETSTIKYCERHGRLEELRNFVIEGRRKQAKARGKELSPQQEKNAVATFDEMLAYFQANPGIWGTAKQPYMRHLVGRMSSHQKLMNSALHHPIQTISKTSAIEIRNEALPLLRHLIEK